MWRHLTNKVYKCRSACVIADVECVGQPTDLIFVVDRSGSICDDLKVSTCENWNITLAFAMGLIMRLDIGAAATRVGLIAYGNLAYIEVPLDKFLDKDELLDAIGVVKYIPNKGTNTSGGLMVMMEEFKKSDSRNTTTLQIGVIISDGKSTREPHKTVPTAQKAKESGITLYVVGVTANIDLAELVNMSSQSDGKENSYFLSPTFDALEQIGEQLGIKICEAVQNDNSSDDTSGNITETPNFFPPGRLPDCPQCGMRSGLHSTIVQLSFIMRRRSIIFVCCTRCVCVL